METQFSTSCHFLIAHRQGFLVITEAHAAVLKKLPAAYLRQSDKGRGRARENTLREVMQGVQIKMAEYFDIVDNNGIPTGKTVSRDTAHMDGIQHRTAHVWIIKEKPDGYEILLQKRSRNKDSFPGQYDTSSAGHIPAGDEPLESALRELKEELGIEAGPEDLQYAGFFHIQYEKEFHGRVFRDNEIASVYVYDTPVDIESLTLQESEVEEVRWFDLEEVWNEIHCNRERICVPTGGLSVLRKYLGIG